MDLAARLQRRLRHTDEGCLMWTGAVDPKGYGRIRLGSTGSKIGTTHRAAWVLVHGPIPDGLVVCHRCDNPSCCNPDHMFLGTPAQNNADMKAKGRARGPKGPKGSLSDERVRSLRRFHELTGCSYAELSRRFGVGASYARRLVLRLQRVE